MLRNFLFVLLAVTMLKVFTPIMDPTSCGFTDTLDVSIAVSNTADRPYYMSFASDGYMWVVSKGTLHKVNPVTGATMVTFTLAGNVYDMDIDSTDNLWIAQGTGIQKINLTTGAVILTYTIAGAYHIAIAADDSIWLSGGGYQGIGTDGNLFPNVANGAGTKHIDATTGGVLASYDALSGCGGLDVAPDGYLWMLRVNCVQRIDPATGTILDSYPDFSHGYDLLSVAPDGTVWAARINDLGILHITATGGTIHEGGYSNVYYDNLGIAPNGDVWIINSYATYPFLVHPFPQLNKVNSTTGAQITGGYNVVLIPDSMQIYYTLDNTTPTNLSSVYSTPIHLTATTHINAIAMLDDYINSDMASENYIKTVVPPTPEPGTKVIKSGILKNSLNQSYVAVLDSINNVVCMRYTPLANNKTGEWKTVGIVDSISAEIKSIILVLKQPSDNLLCMVQLSDGTTKRYRSKSQGTIWLASDLTNPA